MSLQVGIFSSAHMHSHGYAHGLNVASGATLIGVWDDSEERGNAFAEKYGVPFLSDRDELMSRVDAAIITSENVGHIDLLEAAHQAGKPALCEKPIVPNSDHATRLRLLISDGAKIMTAFPCRYSTGFQRVVQRVRNGEVGAIRAVCATNRGRCPFSWFVDPKMSGGGAMIDHVVHVADLLNVLLESAVVSVQAQTGSNMYGQAWEDTAMLTIEYANGVFATLDSSWSRPQNYKTWGDVTMNVVGDKGVIELDMFGQQFETYSEGFGVAGFGSDLDAGLVADFVRFAKGEIAAPITAEDGLRAAEVAMMGYASVGKAEPVQVA